MTPFDNISTPDLLRLQRCVRTYFGQVHRDGVLVSGETTEENHRFMQMWGKVMKRYAEEPETDGMEIENPNSMEIAIFMLDKEIEKRKVWPTG